MSKEQNSSGTNLPPAQTIAGKDYQGRVTKQKCINGFIHKLTIDVYCCPFEEIIVNDENTNVQCSE